MKSIINVNNLKQYEYKGFSKLYQETLEIQIMKWNKFGVLLRSIRNMLLKKSRCNIHWWSEKKKKYFEYLLKLKILNRPIIVIFFLFSFQEKTVIIEREVLKMLKIITQLYNDYTKIYKLAQYRDETFTAYRLKKIFISGGGKLFIFH